MAGAHVGWPRKTLIGGADLRGIMGAYGEGNTGGRALASTGTASRGRKPLKAKLKEIKQELQRRRHEAVAERGRWLAQVVRGYLAYHAVPTNRPAPAARAPAPQSKRPHDRGEVRAAGGALAAAGANPPSLAI